MYPLHVLGSGKSCTINLLLRKRVIGLKLEEAAPVSGDAVGCTFDFKTYENDKYILYDTVGLSQGSMAEISAEKALRLLKKFIRKITEREGIHLLILVTRKDRINKEVEGNFKLFVNGKVNKSLRY